MASLAGLDNLHATTSGRRAIVVHRIRRTPRLYRGPIRNRRLPCVRPRDGRFAEATTRAESGLVVAHSDVQSRVALAQLVQLRRPRALRGSAPARFPGRIVEENRLGYRNGKPDSPMANFATVFPRRPA